MARGSQTNLPGLLVLGVIIFAIGRCSAEPPSTSPPNSLYAASAPEADAAPASAEQEPGAEENRTAAGISYRSSRMAEVDDSEEILSAGRDGFSCQGKRYCREMTSCEEANFYLNQCGLNRLDGDGDGVPCESIC